ncbi:MAG TPA: hypothetical protein VGS79_18910, partial [Puia sp.]|nr:hypothetical protein [Puia sp.]
NNDAGSFEAELLRLLDFGSTPDKHGSLFPDVRVMNEATNESYRVAVKRTQNETNVEFREAAKQHNPKLKAFIEKMHAGAFPKLTVLVGLHDEQKLAKAILKSSYLLGFVNWGYEFVYSTYGGWIREAMLGERAYPVSAPTRLEPKLGSQARKGISIVQLNGEKIAFLMSLELSTATESVIASTFFPNPTITGWNKLVGLKSLEKSKPSVELQAITIPRTIERAGYSAAWSLIQ